jgi:hypothetical protein
MAASGMALRSGCFAGVMSRRGSRIEVSGSLRGHPTARAAESAQPRPKSRRPVGRHRMPCSSDSPQGLRIQKIAKCARSSESLPTGLLCNQYNPECDGKSAIRIWAKFRGYLKQKTIVNEKVSFRFKRSCGGFIAA